MSSRLLPVTILSGFLDPDRFRSWIETFVVERAADLFRSKGVVSLRGMPERLVFQGVHGSFQAARGRLWENDVRSSRAVFIGRDLDRAAIERDLEACRHPDDESSSNTGHHVPAGAA